MCSHVLVCERFPEEVAAEQMITNHMRVSSGQGAAGNTAHAGQQRPQNGNRHAVRDGSRSLAQPSDKIMKLLFKYVNTGKRQGPAAATTRALVTRT